MKRKLPDVSSKYGAPMGRRDNYGISWKGAEPAKFYLQRVPLDSGGYDSGGAYWGIGQPLYWAQEYDNGTKRPADLADFFLRANSREHAKAEIRKDYPAAKFFR
jgi:hypothetical protein